jgi:uncharacterized coiled-coil DUF342 family protein
MDQDTKREFDNLAMLINKGFEGTMQTLRGEMREMRQELKGEISEVQEGLEEVRNIAKRIDYRTQNQVEALYDEIREVQREIDDIRAHVGMPPRRLTA